MKHRTEIIDNKIVNSIEQLASFLKPGDIFRKPLGQTKYKFDELRASEGTVVCENLDTHHAELIYFHSPVYKLVFI